MKNICVIGAGQLGSRHLQAIARIEDNEDIAVYGVDPSDESLTIAKERYFQVATEKQRETAFFLKDIDLLPEEIEVAIIASTSKYRREILINLLNNKCVRFLILEKWLFTNISDLDEIGELLKKSKTKAWVNCTRRMLNCYEYCRNWLGDSKKINCNITGTMFGLMTSLIHFADLMVWLSGCDEFDVDMQSVDNTIIESKRKGYYELTGTIGLKFKNGSVAVINCNREGELPLVIQIRNGGKRILIDETNKIAFFQENISDKETEVIEFKIPFQSELTNIVVQELMNTGECRLPQYEESAKIHKTLMKAVVAYLRKNCDYQHEEFLFT